MVYELFGQTKDLLWPNQGFALAKPTCLVRQVQTRARPKLDFGANTDIGSKGGKTSPLKQYLGPQQHI